MGLDVEDELIAGERVTRRIRVDRRVGIDGVVVAAAVDLR